MIRFTLTAAMVLGLAAVPVLAQTSPQSSPPPGSEEWLRLKGETNRQAPLSKQIPAEMAETRRLNAEIAARNAAAEEAEARARAEYEQANARWREETARAEAQRAEWEARMAACRAEGGTCTAPPPPAVPPPPEG